MLRRSLFALTLAVLIAGVPADEARAHAGLRSSSPRDGVRLGDTPSRIDLSFFERPETVASTIRVLDTAGAAHHIGAPQAVPGDPLSLSIPVRPLKPGVYIVHWRIVSAIDGHVTAGAYAFGVRVSPGSSSVGAANTYPATSRVEVAARALLILGLAVMIGGAAAAIGRFGGTRVVELIACGAAVTVSGLSMLAWAQMRNTGVSVPDLLRTTIGRALVWRAAALAVVAVSLGVAYWARRRARPRLEAGAILSLAVAVLAAIAIHVTAGHAAAVPRLPMLAIAVQWLHFAAAGIWVGGLAALVLAVRGEPGPVKTDAVRRFAAVAAAALVLVTITGAARALQEIPSWRQVLATAYGRTVLAKVVLLAAIAALGARNRWHGVPAAATTLTPLRRIASAELSLMIAVIGAAGILGALPPPSAGGLIEAGTLNASGADFATTVRAALTAESDQPGPNRFTVRVVDYDSEAPIREARVSLRFTPVDDPGVPPSSLRLDPAAGDTYAGSGPNLSFEGRWKVAVLIERASTSTEVQLDVEVRGAPLTVTIERRPGRAPRYSVAIKGEGSIWISPDPDRAGPSTLHISSIDLLSDYRPMEDVVVTWTAEGRPARQLPTRRIDRSNFTAEVDLRPGVNTVVVVGRAENGARLRAVAAIDVPPR